MWPFERAPRPKPPAGPAEARNLRCSFCGKHQDDVRNLIEGPKVFICDECIDLCNDIIAEGVHHEEEASGEPLLLAPTAFCALCRLPKSTGDMLAVSDAILVCRSCVDAVVAAAAAHEGRPT